MELLLAFGMTVCCDDEKSEITGCYDATDLSKYEEGCEVSYTQFRRWGDMVNGQITIRSDQKLGICHKDGKKLWKHPSGMSLDRK